MKGTTDCVTIIQAARCCGVCPKTIQRAIHKGLLPARYPYPNRCEIALSDLEQFMPGRSSGHVQVSTEDRIVALEQRVQVLEQQILDLLNRPQSGLSYRSSRKKTRITGPLPQNLVSLTSFTQLHSVAETRAVTHVDISLLPAKRGAWTDHDGSVVTLALDAKGRQAFYQLYQSFPDFTRCRQCPHGYLDTV